MDTETISVNKTKDLLDNLGIKYNEVTASSEVTDEMKSVSISIKGDELGALIGYHGRNLESLKTIMSLIINKELGKDHSVRVLININDYADKRKEQLKTMLMNAKSVMEAREKASYSFPPMSASDRRTLHTLAQEMGLKTQSEGEGRDRHVNLIA